MKDVVADLHLGVKELAAEDRSGWEPLALSGRLSDVVGVSEAVQVELIRTLADWDRHAAWAEDGAVTPVAWLKANLGMGPGEAAGLVHLARFVAEHRSVRDGLEGGRILVATARLLLRASRRREVLFAACVDGLVDLAAELPLRQFSDVVAHWVDLADDQAPRDDSRRHVSVVEVGEQSRTEIVGDPEDAAIIRAALEALDTPDPADCPEGPRTREQRWYDLTIDVFRRVLVDKLGEDPGAPGSLDIVIDADVAAELVAQPLENAEPLFDGDPLPDVLRPFRDGEADRILRRCHRPDGTKAKLVHAAVLLCCGMVRRVLRDPDTGDVLDVGRGQRRFTKRQLRALVVRDGGCAFPGCDRKPKWCDAHHLQPWDDDGPTDLDNGCLLCRRHHTLVHHGGWTLQRDPATGVFTATAPDGRTFTRRPGERC